MASMSAPLTSQQCTRLAKNTTDSCDGHFLCARCLQQKGCMISTYGECVSHGYDDYVDKYTNFTLAFSGGLDLPSALGNVSVQLSARQYWQFKAGDVSYCEANDATCQLCVSKTFWSSLAYADSRFCVGTGGCVCIFNCEFRCNSFATFGPTPTPGEQTYPPSRITTRPPYTITTRPPYTSWTPLSSTSAEGNDVIYLICSAIGIPVLSCLIVCCRMTRTRRLAQQQTRASERRAPDPDTPAEPPSRGRSAEASNLEETTPQASRPAQLELYGWISHRQNLIDTERRRLNGYEDVIPWARFQTPTQNSDRYL